jgi:hypothetical protein
MAARSESVKKGRTGLSDSIRRLERGKVADSLQHAKRRLRQKARKDLSQRCLVLDLIAIADDDRYRQGHRIEAGADIFDHAAFGPGSLGTGRAPQCILDHALLLLWWQWPAGQHGKRLQRAFARA